MNRLSNILAILEDLEMVHDSTSVNQIRHLLDNNGSGRQLLNIDWFFLILLTMKWWINAERERKRALSV